MAGFGFSSRFKIKKTDEFSSVFNFRKRISGEMLALHYKPNMAGHARLGVIVGKKTARLSVRRNYMKRVIREIFRLENTAVGGLDILVRPLKAFDQTDFDKIRSEFKQLLDKLRKRTDGKHN